MKEIFKPIPDYPNYEVSNFGRVKSLKNTARILKSRLSGSGYLIIGLRKNNIQITRIVHQLVAEAFLGHTPCGHKIIVDHINNIKTDNRVVNLQLVSHRKNLTKDKKTKYSGVYLSYRKDPFRSMIYIDNKSVYLGSYSHEIIAHLAYRKAVKNIHLFNGKTKEFRELINQNY